jgi:two-component system, sensor histidine kinase
MTDADETDFLQRRIVLLQNTLDTMLNTRDVPGLFALSNGDLKALGAYMPDRVILMDPDGVITYINRTIRGLKISEIIGERLQKYAHPENIATLNNAIAEVNATLQPVQYELEVHIDSNSAWLLTRLIPIIDTGVITKLLAIVTDITVQHETARKLLLSQQRLSLIIESTPLAAVVWDRNYRCTEWNHAAEAIFGWTREEALGVEFTRLIVPESEWDSRKYQFDCALTTGAIHKYPPYLNQTKSGELITCEWWSNTVKNAVGEVIGIASFAQDVTKKLQAEKDLQEAKAHAEASARAKSLFLANMSHEIRTPLNGIVGLLELAQDQPMSEPLADSLQLIRQSTQILLAIVNDILDFSRIENGAVAIESAPTDINAVLTNVHALMQPLARKKNLQFTMTPVAAGCSWLLSDAKRLSQIIGNLVANAVKFTEQGRVHIEANVTPAVAAGAWQTLSVAVTDTGIGIAADKLHHIFQDFAQQDETITRRFGGSGLGLTISQRLARLMDGEIKVVSTPGQGSRFQLELQVQGCAAPDEPQGTNIVCERNYRRHALVVDDNRINLMVAEKMLQKLGITTVTAHNGQDALNALHEGNNFDIMLLDVQMPDLDGITVCQRIRANGLDARTLPILAITANVLADERQRCLQAGMNGFIGKPFTLLQLANELDRWLL